LMTTGSGIRNPERDKFAWFVLYMGQKNYAIVRKDVKATSASEFLADNSLTWGVIRSYRHGQDADSFLARLGKQRIHEGVNLDSEYRMLKTGRISAMFSPAPVAEKYLKELDLAADVRIEDWFPADPNIPHGFIFSKKYFTEVELQKWRVVFNEMLRDGSLKKIYAKYLGEASANRLLQFTPE
jgi:polar amino acid transport system substrate-binding protein